MALAASGYQAERTGHHFRVLQSLEFTLGPDEAALRKLDFFRKKRNVSDYERSGAVSEAEVEEMHRLALQLRKQVVAWLRERHPELTP